MEQREAFYEAYRHIKRPGADKLLEWLERSDFFTAPASTKYHLAREGGLCEHSVHVYNRLRELYLAEIANYQELTPEQEETVAVSGLLHDICKTNLYATEMRNQKTYDAEKVVAAESWQVKHDAQGDFIWESVPRYVYNDKLPYGHGEKSVYIISGFIRLSREEAMAIRWHMGFSDSAFQGGDRSVGTAFEMYPLAVLTHLAELQATYLDEKAESS